MHGNSPNRLWSLTLDLKLICSRFIHNISVHAHRTYTHNKKTLNAIAWENRMRHLMAPYKAVMRQTLEYTSYILQVCQLSGGGLRLSDHFFVDEYIFSLFFTIDITFLGLILCIPYKSVCACGGGIAPYFHTLPRLYGRF